MNQTKIQYWLNSTQMGTVDAKVAEEIKTNARNAGLKVYDNGHYFTVVKP